VIIERKDCADLLDSIQHKNVGTGGNRSRYQDQKMRIISSDIKNRYYIIENNMEVASAASAQNRYICIY
jgi:ERCC4-type nuclease